MSSFHYSNLSSANAIHKALDEGINWIDTAAASEEVVARGAERNVGASLCVFQVRARRRRAEECEQESEADFIRKEIENSLRRLQVEQIDLYQIHWPTEDLEEGWRALADAQKEGKLRWIGVWNFDVPQLEAIRKIAPVSSLQPPYSLLFPEIEKEILPYCQKNNIGVIVYSPMASGLLAGTWTHDRLAKLPADDWRRTKSPHYQEPAFTWNIQLAELLREIGNSHGRSAGETAIAWTLRFSGTDDRGRDRRWRFRTERSGYCQDRRAFRCECRRQIAAAADGVGLTEPKSR